MTFLRQLLDVRLYAQRLRHVGYSKTVAESLRIACMKPK
jgi:hypothetical protein